MATELDKFKKPYGDLKYIMEKKEFFSRISKLGRNDKCFCGSDKKFKKCCLKSIRENI